MAQSLENKPSTALFYFNRLFFFFLGNPAPAVNMIFSGYILMFSAMMERNA